MKEINWILEVRYHLPRDKSNVNIERSHLKTAVVGRPPFKGNSALLSSDTIELAMSVATLVNT